MRSKTNFVLVAVLLSMGVTKAGTWTTIPVSHIRGISGDNIVGTVHDGLSSGAGVYNMDTQIKIRLDYPEGTGTVTTGIDGSNIVGYYQDSSNENHQFLYNGTDWETLELPSNPSGIDGSNIFGYGNWVYNLTTQNVTTFNFPGASNTTIIDMDGDNIVGGYVGTAGHFHGFLYNGTSWIDIDPGLPDLTPTLFYGISGNYAVGLGTDAFNYNHGLLYNITTQNWTVLNYPGAIETSPSGIDGNNIVGDYEIESSHNSFLYTIPEPTSLLLLGLGGLVLRRKRK